jgi:2-C-methyl-D-erythritol 4-phosphate cytidylyltransferase
MLVSVRWGAVIVAAGRGTRFGGPKQFVEIAGLPMVGWSLRAFAAMPEIEEIAVATEPQWLERMRELAARVAPARPVSVVSGGASRQHSVLHGLRAIAASCDAVLVHDGARPLVKADDVRAGMREVHPGRGAVLAAPVVDTIKVVDAASMIVSKTLDRSQLWAAQTPQFATREDLLRAHAHAGGAGVDATDDVALLEAIGVEVVVVPAGSENFKVTHLQDVTRAETVIRAREKQVSS